MPDAFPTFDRLMNPCLRALRDLGGSAGIDELDARVVANEDISEEVQGVLHDEENSNQTELAYRLAWARTYLKKCGFIANSSRGVWSLTPIGVATPQVDSRVVVREVRAQARASAPNVNTAQSSGGGASAQDRAEDTWRDQLHVVLTRDITPQAFERLAQRLLRESGFTHVEVTGRTGDGGIDGRGLARINGLMSFHVLFQCKRYTGSVGAREIRDFRGAMVGRTDKGLFITTGSFSPAAVQEATRDGAPPIELIDGRDPADRLKQLGMGIRTEVVEVQSVDREWYAGV